MTKTKQINYSKVDIGQAHFTLFYKPDDDDDLYQIAVMSVASDLDDIRIELLDTHLPDNVMALLENEVRYYLYELNPSGNTEQILGYLYYHVGTVSNFYGPIVWGYVGGITSRNICYYLETQSKIIGIHNRSLVTDLKECYFALIGHQLFIEALGKTDNTQDAADYNKQLTYLYRILHDELPQKEKFELVEVLNLVEFAYYVAGLTIQEYVLLLNYLLYKELIKNKHLTPLLTFFYINYKLYRDYNVTNK